MTESSPARYDGPLELARSLSAFALSSAASDVYKRQDIVVTAGSGLSQPAGVAHNVVARSDDLEVLEINVPAQYGTYDLAEPPKGAA